MNLNEFVELLENNPESPLHIMLPSGELVPENFHVTEIGQIQKTFIDCGGTKRESTSCLMQVWTADDTDHRLSSGKLLTILKLAETIIASKDIPLEIEYGSDVASQYSLQKVKQTPKGMLFVLAGKQTDCLAPDKCGVKCQGCKCC